MEFVGRGNGFSDVRLTESVALDPRRSQYAEPPAEPAT
jgi:hypothetical protein